MSFLRAFTLSVLMMLFITPKLMQLAYKINYLEKPQLDNERKIHKESKPYLAGVGLFFLFWITYFIISSSYNTKVLKLIKSDVI